MTTRKNILLTLIATILFLNMILINTPTSYGANGDSELAVAPQAVNGIALNLIPGQTFYINITIWNVTMMLGYQFRLSYDTNVLTATSFQSYAPFTFQWPSSINDTGGYVDMSYSWPLPEPFGTDVFEGDPRLPVARIDFTVQDYGFSPFNLSNAQITFVTSPPPAETPRVVNGRFYNTEIHDVAVTNVVPNQTLVLQNHTISIAVTVFNNGTFDDSFDVTTYYDSTAVGPPQSITNLIPKTSQTLTFSWNTTGVVNGTYTMGANATTVPGETYFVNNDKVDGTVGVVLIAPHDIAVISAVPSPAFVIQGDNVTIDVTVENKGLAQETFNVSAYYNLTLIATQSSVSVPALANQTFTFTWNTTGVSIGFYTISANATVVPEETNTTNNGLIDGQVGVGSADVNILALNVLPSPAVVGTNISLEAVIQNDGKQNATYTVSFYYGTTLIGNQTVTNQTEGMQGIVNPTVFWNTSAISAGQYILKARVEPLPGELNTANNERTHTLTLVPKAHDIAVTEISANATSVLRGKAVFFNVTLVNQGNVNEIVTVNLSFGSTLIETKAGISIAVGETKVVNFTWTTSSSTAPLTYTITAAVPALSGETDTADNSATTQVAVEIHDIAITNVTVSKTTAGIGESVTVTVTIRNLGNFTESFTVTAKYGTTNIATQNVNNFAEGQTRTLTFTWSTTGVSAGTYTISATASTVTDEANLTNNTLEDGSVTLKPTSTITLTATPDTVTVGDKVTISGAITPARSGVRVTIWYRVVDTTTGTNLTAVLTDANSQYSYEWTTTTAGDFELYATWPGDAATMGAQSDFQNVTVNESPSTNILLYVGIGIVAIIVIALILFYVFRMRRS